MVDARDYHYMSRALTLAGQGLYTTDPNPRVGCVLVKDERVIGEGWHVRAGEAHAELIALEQAGAQARGATVYVTLEPCCHHGRTAPCTDALLAAGVARVVAAMEDPNPQVAGRGLAQLRSAGIAVECGLMADEAHALNPGFVQRMRRGRPWVRCKLAMSLDGRTAMASGESQWITGEAARQDVQRLRARSSAIMTGAATVLADDPSLTVRLPSGAARQPLRVLLDSRLRTPPTARTLHQAGPVLIFTAVTEARYHETLRATGADIAVLPRSGEGLDLDAVLAELGRREINELHLESGAALAGAMLRRGLLDELIVYMAPLLLGDGARSLFHLPGLTRMSERIRLDIADIRAVGRDWRITAYPAGRSATVP
jgi:diaminohydroxyphosphoribosylaminopyrimidine deaminase/5-amino-6-(5-phosphoribosylamino)uracil reductase